MYHTAGGLAPFAANGCSGFPSPGVGEEACCGLLARNKIWFKPSAAVSPSWRHKLASTRPVIRMIAR
jgi:hypothetical protein